MMFAPDRDRLLFTGGAVLRRGQVRRYYRASQVWWNVWEHGLHPGEDHGCQRTLVLRWINAFTYLCSERAGSPIASLTGRASPGLG